MSARRPARGRGIRVCLCTSVTASRMTDAYGASTLAGAARRPTMGYRLEMRIIPGNISIPASEGCPFPRHRSSHVVATTDVKGLVWTVRPLAGRREGMSARRPARGRGIRVCFCTSVTASRMTDAYGASTLAGAARRPTMGYRLEMRIIPGNISIPASEGCPFPRHRSSHVVATTDVKGLVWTVRPLAGRREGMSARRPARGRGIKVCLCTSVTASRMTDAYGASTLAGAVSGGSHSYFLHQMQIIGRGESGGVNLHQMQIIGRLSDRGPR